jgi:hypothetical protein
MAVAFVLVSDKFLGEPQEVRWDIGLGLGLIGVGVFVIGMLRSEDA